ncbi:pectinesterase, partial [Rhizoctonia solani AG-3 Rhs1AP]
MPSFSDSGSSPTPVPLNTGFQDAGDFTLKSSDNVEFKVYRLFLMTASPVFQDILTSGSGPPVMELSEDGETIAALLQYIYPRENPVIKDYGLFAKVLEAARKYELGFITSDLRASMHSDSTSFSCLRAEPLRMYALAVRHELKEEISIAAKLTIGKYDFASIEAASELCALDIPLKDAVMLMRMHMARAQALSDLLVNVDSNPRYFAGFPVRCSQHQQKGGAMSELQRTWMKEVVNLLRKETLDSAAAQRLFEKEFFLNLKLRCECLGCRDAEMYDLAHGAWAGESRVKLAELKLDDL